MNENGRALVRKGRIYYNNIVVLLRDNKGG